MAGNKMEGKGDAIEVARPQGQNMAILQSSPARPVGLRDRCSDFPGSSAAAGIRAVIEPGGSVRDDEVIKAADEHGIAMVFTGMRHFRH